MMNASDIKLVSNTNEWVVNDWLDGLIADGKLDQVRPITRRDVLTLLRQLQEATQNHPESNN
jgi:hypothetical protein